MSSNANDTELVHWWVVEEDAFACGAPAVGDYRATGKRAEITCDGCGRAAKYHDEHDKTDAPGPYFWERVFRAGKPS